LVEKGIKMNFYFPIFLLLLVSNSPGLAISCVLKHSASAGIDDSGNINVHTSDEDSIIVKIEGIGQDIAIFNSSDKLQLIKTDKNAFYYQQETVEGVIIWAYFLKTNVLTYAKIRAFPVLDKPSSYLMISKCKLLQ
jgi:hypothetical protein